MRDGWFADILLSDRPHAARIAVTTMLEGGREPREIYLDVLAPALVEVGRRWETGEVTVAQEHLATAVVSLVMDILAPMLDDEPQVARTIVLAATAGNFHVVGLNMIEDFLQGDGWEVHNLGAASPADSLTRLVGVTGADAVGLSTSLTTHLRDAADTIEQLRTLPDPLFIIVGGQAYGGSSKMARQVGADAFAVDAGAASSILRNRFPGGRGTVALRKDLARRAAALERLLADPRSGHHSARLGPKETPLLPVCAWCGRVRSDQGAAHEWQSAAAFLTDLGVPVSHSRCDSCASVD